MVGIVVFVVFVLVAAYSATRGEVSIRHLRGNRLISFAKAKARAARLPRGPDGAIVFGRVQLPMPREGRNFMVSGTPGSGKTTLLRILMQCFVPLVGEGKGHRVLVFDGKRELLGVLLGMRGPKTLVVDFDPFAEHGSSWNIARDVDSPAAANEIASLLFPRLDAESQPFFSDAVRLIASGIVKVFIQTRPGAWTFTELIVAMRTPDSIRAVLELTPEGNDTLRTLFQDGTTLDNVVSTLATKIEQYKVVAALWSHAPTTYSLQEWMDGESVILIRSHHMASDAVAAVNRAMFVRAAQVLLSQHPGGKRTWVILDELATAGKLEIEKNGGSFGLTDLLDKGRSYSVNVVLAFQSISAIRKIYEEHLTVKITDLCTNRAFLRFESKESAEWAAGFYGKQEVRVTSRSRTSGQQPTTTTSHQNQDRNLIEPSEFQAFPLADARSGLHGYFTIGSVGSFKDVIPGGWLYGGALMPVVQGPRPNGEFPERSPDKQWLQGWPVQLPPQSASTAVPTQAAPAPSSHASLLGSLLSPGTSAPTGNPPAASAHSAILGGLLSPASKPASAASAPAVPTSSTPPATTTPRSAPPKPKTKKAAAKTQASPGAPAATSAPPSNPPLATHPTPGAPAPLPTGPQSPFSGMGAALAGFRASQKSTPPPP